MPRKKLIRTNLFPYHVITRCNNKEWFRVPIERVWDFLKKSLVYANEKHPMKFHCVTLMNNHYHLVITTPFEDIDKFMEFFNKRLSDQIRVESSKINRVFGGRYTWSLVDNQKYRFNVVRYVFQNPLRAGLAERVENYPYSSLYYEYNDLKFPLEVTSLFDCKNIEMIENYNERVSMEKVGYIRKGLRKSSFCPPRCRNSREPFEL